MNMNKARSFLNIAVTVFVTTQSAAAIPEVPTLLLGNTAIPGLTIPAIGLGTGAYSDVNLGNASSYPECWTGNGGAGGGAGSCGLYVRDAVTAWLQAGGRRIDAANSYQDQVDVGIAMNNFINSGAATREEIFLLSKVGPSHPLGGNDVKAQFHLLIEHHHLFLLLIDEDSFHVEVKRAYQVYHFVVTLGNRLII